MKKKIRILVKILDDISLSKNMIIFRTLDWFATLLIEYFDYCSLPP